VEWSVYAGFGPSSLSPSAQLHHQRLTIQEVNSSPTIVELRSSVKKNGKQREKSGKWTGKFVAFSDRGGFS
jgi:hypothetical protein